MLTGVSTGVATGVAVGVCAVGLAVGFGVGLGVGFGFGLGVAGGRQLLTPLPETLPLETGARYFAGGSVPVGGKIALARARMSPISGFWIEPRLSYAPRTSGWVMTAR